MRKTILKNGERGTATKEDAAAPTIALESVSVTATIDAKEKREVVTINIPVAFLHAVNDNYVIMKMNGSLAELMVKPDPINYRKYVTIEKGRQVLYLCLQKSLVRHDEKRLTILYEARQRIKRDGF